MTTTETLAARMARYAASHQKCIEAADKIGSHFDYRKSEVASMHADLVALFGLVGELRTCLETMIYYADLLIMPESSGTINPKLSKLELAQSRKALARVDAVMNGGK